MITSREDARASNKDDFSWKQAVTSARLPGKSPFLASRPAPWHGTKRSRKTLQYLLAANKFFRYDGRANRLALMAPERGKGKNTFCRPAEDADQSQKIHNSRKKLPKHHLTVFTIAG